MKKLFLKKLEKTIISFQKEKAIFQKVLIFSNRMSCTFTEESTTESKDS